jgi:hypothetical protein
MTVRHITQLTPVFKPVIKDGFLNDNQSLPEWLLGLDRLLCNVTIACFFAVLCQMEGGHWKQELGSACAYNDTEIGV